MVYLATLLLWSVPADLSEYTDTLQAHRVACGKEWGVPRNRMALFTVPGEANLRFVLSEAERTEETVGYELPNLYIYELDRELCDEIYAETLDDSILVICDDAFDTVTVRHELSHVADTMYFITGKDHGKEWQELARAIGVPEWDIKQSARDTGDRYYPPGGLVNPVSNVGSRGHGGAADASYQGAQGGGSSGERGHQQGN